MAPKQQEPTEASVLETLKRGPMRPSAPSPWSAGTSASALDAKTRLVLERLVETGLVEKKPGGWYRLTETGRGEK